VDEVGEEALIVHDAHRSDPSLAFELAHLAERPTGPTPIGIFRDIDRAIYGESTHRQLVEAREKVTADDLEQLLHAGGTWTVE
jgi:2-oxoglutarate ferredoxin oxidoreductase subunit beta